MTKSKDRDFNEIMVSELRHRTMNFFNLMSSVLRIKLESSQHGEDTRKFGYEILTLIDSFRSIFTQFVYREERAPLMAGDLFQQLTKSLRSFPVLDSAEPVRLDTRIEPLELPGDSIVPLTLITVESYTNSLKYAFPEHHEGEKEFHIHLRKKNEQAQLILRDNGVGLSQGKKKHEPGTGMEIMKSLGVQLRGSIEFLDQGGTEVRLHFPID
ncbi:MAG TPA: sensor histidine kinase [Sediminispirochaeta sp.]|nr:sensor histidine kinase [Sediminispirochaeta sp.]